MCTKVLQLEEDTLSKILQTFEKNEKSCNDDITIIKDWMRSQPHLPEIMVDEKIRNFLIMNKFSIENTKKKIDAYYTMRSMKFELLINPKVKGMMESMDISHCVPFPKLTKEMYRVYWLRADASTIEQLNPLYAFGVYYNEKEITLVEDVMLADVFVCDMSGVPFSYAQKGISFLPKTLALFEKVYSSRVKEIFFINCPSFITTIMTIIKPVMKTKIYERIHVHTDAKILHQRFSKDLIPKEYGGEGQSLASLTEMWKLKFKETQSLFDQLDELTVNENLRPSQLKNDELLGFHGNFKKLDLD